MADVLGVPVIPSREPEASARGAALLALEALGAVGSVDALPGRLGAPVEPDATCTGRYQAGLARHRELYDTLLPLFTGPQRAGGSRA
jgi:gluconokinase